MPHSLRAKLSGLRYKGILEDKDYKRLCKALDKEDVLKQIRAEIEQIQGNEYEVSDMQGNRYKYETIEKAEALQIIDKYREERGTMNSNRIEKKLEESYQHIKPYLKEQKILQDLCQGCECWYGEEHDYEECHNRPCFRMFLGYEYMVWEDSFR